MVQTTALQDTGNDYIQNKSFKKRKTLIVLSVALTLVLIALCFYYFLIRQKKLSNIANDFRTLVALNSKEEDDTASYTDIVAQQDQITRGELAKYLVDVFNLSIVNSDDKTFDDVSPNSSEYSSIETFYKNNITTGCASDPLMFCPDRIATRAEAVTFIIRILNLPLNIDPNFNGYSDVKGHPLEQYLLYAEQIGIRLDCNGNNFCPDEAITGEELNSLIEQAQFVHPEAPMRWIQPNYHPDKLTIWETAFEYPELWDNTFKNTDVLGLFIYSIDANPHGYLDKVATVVKKYNLKVNVELSGLMETTSCGENKGEESAALTIKLLKPLYDRGINVDYLSIDGSGVTMISMLGCENMATDLAISELVQYMQIIHKTYPDIKFGLLPNFAAFYYEGIDNYWGPGGGFSYMPDYFDLLNKILAKVEEKNEYIDFVLVDYPYEIVTNTATYGFKNNINWLKRLFYLENQVERNGIKFGVIFNSEGQNHQLSNKNFYDNVMNYKSLYNGIGGTPGIMMIESWYSFPDVFVPDYVSYTFTNLAAKFFGYPISTNLQTLNRRDAAIDTIRLFNISQEVSSNNDFSDVLTSDIGFNAIEIMYKKGFTTGCDTNPLRYCPDRPLTRGEAITFLLRASGIDISVKNTVSFKDVPSTFALYKYITFAAENGLSMGCNTNGNFCPNDIMTLGEWENLATKILNLYYSKKSCSLVSRCSTAYNGQTVSYYPDPRNGCYDFRLFPIYPVWEHWGNCPGSYSVSGKCSSYTNCVCRQYVSCCTTDLGLKGSVCK